MDDSKSVSEKGDDDSPHGIKARRMALGWSQHVLAAAAGIDQQRIVGLERLTKTGKVPNSKYLDRVLAALDAAEANPPARPEPMRRPRIPSSPNREGTTRVKVYALSPDEMTGKLALSHTPVGFAPVPDNTADPSGMFGIEQRRDDMFPMFRPRDHLVVSPLSAPQPGSGVVLMNEDETDVLTREFCRETATTWEMMRYGYDVGIETFSKAEYPRCLVIVLTVHGR
jgi:transcriptional regulator with XRE-family HTH domain